MAELRQQFDVNQSVTLGALAAGIIVKDASQIDSARLQGFRIVKSRFFITMTGKTTAEGPLLFGVACNFPDVTAIKSALEADPQGKTANDLRGEGTYLRLLDTVGLVPTVFPSSDEGTGKMYEVSYGKNGWTIPEGRELALFFMNQDSSALTTGTAFHWEAEHFGVWLND